MKKYSQYIQSKLSRIHPALLFLYSYLAAISAGTALLMLPVSTVSGFISFIDALFTATSAVCVTGLIVVDTGSYFTLFGQWVILGLIQLGGLGIMTVSVALFQIIGKKVLFRHRMAMQEIFTHTPRKDIYQLVKSIFIFTAIAELIGTIFLTFHWIREYPFFKALYTAFFHAVSAFCNAGFSSFANSFMGYKSSLILNLTICTLIILGGIGFPVVYELYDKMFKTKDISGRYSVHTKTVLLTTSILIVLGMVVLFNTNIRYLASGNLREMLLVSFFQSVTCRTAGFNTVDIGSLNSSALTFMMFLMLVGASPGSCGGGIKTTTLALLGSLSLSRIRGRLKVNMFRKTIPGETVTRSISMVFLSIMIITFFFFLILVAQQGQVSGKHHGEFLEYLFETISAFGTVGLSTGATQTLTSLGKFYIIILMLIGRLGVAAFAYILTGFKTAQDIEFAEENIMIG
jgi:trk system potassium uptake protein